MSSRRTTCPARRRPSPRESSSSSRSCSSSGWRRAATVGAPRPRTPDPQDLIHRRTHEISRNPLQGAAMTRTTHRRRLMLATGTALAGVLFLSACSTDTDDTDNSNSSSSSENKSSSANDDPGEKVVLGFSGPAADHGWLAAINSSAIEEAKKYS